MNKADRYHMIMMAYPSGYATYHRSVSQNLNDKIEDEIPLNRRPGYLQEKIDRVNDQIERTWINEKGVLQKMIV